MKLKRRTFISSAVAVFGGLMVITQKVFQPVKFKKPQTARFLTQDGKLVEVDLSKVSFEKKKISKNQLIKWVWKDQTI